MALTYSRDSSGRRTIKQAVWRPVSPALGSRWEDFTNRYSYRGARGLLSEFLVTVDDGGSMKTLAYPLIAGISPLELAGTNLVTANGDTLELPPNAIPAIPGSEVWSPFVDWGPSTRFVFLGATTLNPALAQRFQVQPGLVLMPQEVAVNGIESVETPAGTFDCYRVQVSYLPLEGLTVALRRFHDQYSGTASVSVRPPHRLVRFVPRSASLGPLTLISAGSSQPHQ